MTTSAIGSASRVGERPAPEDDPPLTRIGRRVSVEEIARAASSKIDADLAAFVANAAAAPPGPKNDDVLYLGINAKSADGEARALASTGVNVLRVAVSKNDVPNVRAFVDGLGLSRRVADDVARVLENASPNEREMLAAVAFAWANAERGGTSPSRLVISGHSGRGREIWSNEGFLSLANVRKLAEAMPRAAAQIEDVHFSACSTSANAAERSQWQAAFPNLRSLWSYDGSAPSPASGHLVAWSRLTKGRSDLAIDETLKRGNVAAWSAKAGYQDRPRSLESIQTRAREAEGRLASYKDGSVVAGHDDTSESDYRALTRLADRADAPPAQRAEAAVDAMALLRLRYYGPVRERFAATNRGAIADGFRALGLPAPDFAKLARKDALAAMATFDFALARHPNPPAAATTLAPTLRGFANLDPKTIPESWCSE